ncbi:hypothetical protein OQ496_13315 [Acetobacter suratthaniensis]|uniref:Flagellar hook-associated protein 2 C-terminal domain-containing protein n=1 Tax=Acetobacter suratthaniensis TaxID=1502841 RepID=A0ABS3LPX6_9PROT|nr:hypothetical protein [Acetobacter suratthaniensis]MBO1329396.1 hypothetical protein [Acetobacter suratthaniensis]MCX2567426.1 hypothetical protein [Acetobacter suratthaniensis]
MSTITTTNLSWSATWSQAPVTPNALNVSIYGENGVIQHGNSVVSSSSETSSADDDTTGDTLTLSQEAQTYIDTQSSGITANSTLSKIYGAIVQVLGSSTASDSEKWNAFVADERLSMESARNDGIWGNINVFSDSSAMATPYMQKIKAAYDDLNKNNNVASNQMEQDITGLFQENATADLSELWGNASLSLDVTQTTAKTDSGTVTSFSISSALSGKMEYAVGTGPNIKQALVKTDVNTPTSFSSYNDIQTVTVSGNKNDLKAEFEKEIVDELFGSSGHKNTTSALKTGLTSEAETTESSTT